MVINNKNRTNPQPYTITAQLPCGEPYTIHSLNYTITEQIHNSRGERKVGRYLCRGRNKCTAGELGHQPGSGDHEFTSPQPRTELPVAARVAGRGERRAPRTTRACALGFRAVAVRRRDARTPTPGPPGRREREPAGPQHQVAEDHRRRNPGPAAYRHQGRRGGGLREEQREEA